MGIVDGKRLALADGPERGEPQRRAVRAVFLDRSVEKDAISR